MSSNDNDHVDQWVSKQDCRVFTSFVEAFYIQLLILLLTRCHTLTTYVDSFLCFNPHTTNAEYLNIFIKRLWGCLTREDIHSMSWSCLFNPLFSMKQKNISIVSLFSITTVIICNPVGGVMGNYMTCAKDLLYL